ncbi:MAG: transporter substrate-binding domain-containing protein [Candidatus Caldatribacteriota bacterium]|nr:transporter substrate-binding domain-containing protein [Atribacterota bacterium]MDD4289304.1 transporter substrate-binding domain-containing protein [Atribacterota bacterium]MDD4765088.1 transporter substrate-binding domain-containing protein [Atribacterota bacterium]MDD5635651.1 transporter substrate-binding domain-containing protein [Atribacterota bacterium]MDI9596818.1 transporter substrate-binding domain-containing protein [Atribacterota bacterium]
MFNKLVKISLSIIIVLLISSVLTVSAAPEKIVVGTSADWPPFEWIDANNNFVGFDMDIMKIIARVQGYEIEINDIGFDSLIPAIQSGRIDVMAAGATLTPERLEVADASNTYWSGSQGVMVVEDSALNIATALAGGNSVGAQRGTTQADWLEENLVGADVDIKVELYETNDLGIMDLVNGRIDAFVADTPAAEAFTKHNPIKIVGTINTEEEYVFYVQKGDPKEILPLINEGLAKIQQTPIWDNLVNAYFMGDLNKISDCYGEYGDLLDEDLEAFTQNLAECMMAN